MRSGAGTARRDRGRAENVTRVRRMPDNDWQEQKGNAALMAMYRSVASASGVGSGRAAKTCYAVSPPVRLLLPCS